MITCFVTPEHCELCMHFLLNCAGWYVFFALCGVVVRFWDCTRSTTPDINHIRHPPHQTTTTSDIHHTMCEKGHPSHQTYLTICKKGHPPHQTFTTPDIHHTRHPPYQTTATPCVKKDIHHTRHPPHHTSTTPCVKRHPDIHHKRPPLHLTSTTPDIHHIRYLPHHV